MMSRLVLLLIGANLVAAAAAAGTGTVEVELCPAYLALNGDNEMCVSLPPDFGRVCAYVTVDEGSHHLRHHHRHHHHRHHHHHRRRGENASETVKTVKTTVPVPLLLRVNDRRLCADDYYDDDGSDSGGSVWFVRVHLVTTCAIAMGAFVVGFGMGMVMLTDTLKSINTVMAIATAASSSSDPAFLSTLPTVFATKV